MKVKELIEKLKELDDNLDIEVSTGHEEKGGRFYGLLYRASIVDDYKGKRVLLTGKLEE